MPAHVQNLLVEIDLIGVCLLAHPLRASHRTGRATSTLLAILTRPRARSGIHRSGNADFFRLECAFVSLKDDLGVVALIGGVDHEVVIVGASHDVLGVTREDYFKLVKDAVVFIGVA